MGMNINPAFATFMSGAGLMAGAAGAYKTAAGQKAALTYQSNVADSNAQIAEEQAKFALMNGEREEQASRLKMAALLGDQKAVAAANGVDVATGSPVELMASTRFIGENDALTIRDNAARQAWAYRENARGYRNEAAMDRSTSKSMSPWMSAFGSLLTNAGTVNSRWNRYNESQYGKGG
jgi:hypothetical protein